MFRHFAKLFCILMLLCLLPIIALASPTLTIEDDASDVPPEVVANLIAEYPDAGAITIMAHHTGTNPAEAAADELPLTGLSIGTLIAMLLAGVWTVLRRSAPA